MIGQLNLGGEPVVFGDDKASREAARAVLRRIVKRLGGKVASAATGLAESHISKALSDEPGDRYLHQHHVDALLKLATSDECRDYWTARMSYCGVKPMPVCPRTLEERFRDLEWKVATRLGPPGLAIVEEERSIP